MFLTYIHRSNGPDHAVGSRITPQLRWALR